MYKRQTVGWKLIDIPDDNATADTDGNNWIQTAFNDDEDQSRWFWFKSNGKKQTSANTGDTELKQKTIDGKKYAFDQYGRMVAEWVVDMGQAEVNYTSATGNKTYTAANGVQVLHQTPGSGNVAVNEGDSRWSSAWMYFNSVEDGARVAKNWFKVVPAEGLNSSKYNDDEDGWYYADGNGHLYASEFKTIKGKKYGFDNKGKMIDGLKFIHYDSSTNTVIDSQASDNDYYPFDTEDGFDENSLYWASQGYKCYYFGSSSDGAMKTGKMQIDIDGDNYTFNFGKSGSNKGAGKTGEDDKKYYNSGKLMAAGKDEKYQVIFPVANISSDRADTTTKSTNVKGYKKYEDAAQFASKVSGGQYTKVLTTVAEIQTLSTTQLNQCGLNATKRAEDKYGDLKVFMTQNDDGTWSLGLPSDRYMVVNSTGSVSKSNSKIKDGNDVYYKLYGGKIVSTFSEN